MLDGDHPAARHEANVRSTAWRGAAAGIALGVTAVLDVAQISVRVWQSTLIHAVQAGVSPGQDTLGLSDTLVRDGAIAQLALMLVTCILFLRWLSPLVRLTRALGARTLEWTPQQAVWAFFIPVVSLLRPYQVLRDVHGALAPDVVPEPPLRSRADEAGGYRHVEVLIPPPSGRLPRASILAWWAFYWAGTFMAELSSKDDAKTLDALLDRNLWSNVAALIRIASAVLAIMMIRAVTARLVERYRRVRHNSMEALESAGITIT
jgi:hypothetical protein